MPQHLELEPARTQEKSTDEVVDKQECFVPETKKLTLLRKEAVTVASNAAEKSVRTEN